jgi:hypothetical protein
MPRKAKAPRFHVRFFAKDDPTGRLLGPEGQHANPFFYPTEEAARLAAADGLATLRAFGFASGWETFCIEEARA